MSKRHRDSSPKGPRAGCPRPLTALSSRSCFPSGPEPTGSSAFRAGTLSLDRRAAGDFESWASAAARAGLTVKVELSAIAVRRPPSGLELLRAGLAEGLRARSDRGGDGLARVVEAIRDDWRSLE